ncbi:MAG: 5'-methylthioadenosine/S-adenosylhomocysteine nucleosidase [Chlamydiae bacterium]|nr:5'-methylthioadenosine/S-adenosylhomocysteine nucleosidase [Chlamydiota bacterium]
MRIGIISALESENNLLVKYMDNISSTEKGSRSYICGDLWGLSTVLAVSKMGKVAAAITATQMIADFHTDFILFTGVAGGIQKNLKVGDIVVANALVQHDMDSSPLFPRYEIPLTGIREFIPDQYITAQVKQATTNFLDKELHNYIEKNLLREFKINSPKVVEGMIASGDCFISSQRERNKLLEELPEMSCVEMEGAAVAQVCYEYDVPFSVIRTISDAANKKAAIDFERFILKVASGYSLGIIKELFNCLDRSA